MCLKDLYKKIFNTGLFKKIKLETMYFHEQRTEQTDCYISKMKSYESIKNECSDEY